MDYVEDYTLEERLGTAGRQQNLQNKKAPQESAPPAGKNGKETISKLQIFMQYNTFSD